MSTIMQEYNDDSSFQKVLASLQNSSTKNKNARSVRLAAVTAAMAELNGGSTEDHVLAARVYGSCLTALQANLEKEDCDIATIVSLTDLLTATIPYVSGATLNATLSLSSRVLRGIEMTSSTVVESSNNNNAVGVNAMLRASSHAVAVLLIQLDNSNTNVQPKQIKQLVKGTLLTLLNDKRPKVRKEAQQQLMRVLLETQNNAVQHVITAYIESVLQNSDNAEQLQHVLRFLQLGIMELQNAEKLGAEITQLLLHMMQEQQHKNTSNKQQSNHNHKNATATNALLLLEVLESMLSHQDPKQERFLNEFASHVLASLLQQNVSSLVAKHELQQQFRIHYGKVLLLLCQRLLSSSLGYKLFPLVLQKVLVLCRDGVLETSRVLMVDLTQLLRSTLCKGGSCEDENAYSEEYTTCLTKSLSCAHDLIMKHVFRETWSVTLPILAILLQQVLLVDDYESQAHEVVSSLLTLHDHVVNTNDGVAKLAIEQTLSSLVQGVGMERAWPWLEFGNQGVLSSRAWLLPLLKDTSNSVPQRLGFFQSTILPLARECDVQSVKNSKQHQYHTARVVDLWSLFGICCQRPPDVPETFPSLAQTLIKAMGDHERYPQLVTIICGGLKMLAVGISERQEEAEAETDDAQVMQQVSTKLLPALFKLVETLQGTNTNKPQNDKNKTFLETQRVESVTTAIAAICPLAPKPFLPKLFTKVMQRLLKATQAGDTDSICTLLSLTQALVVSSSLSDGSVSLLYRSLKPLCRSDEFEARVQKRAYKVLADICQRHPTFVLGEQHLEELIELLTGSIMTCQVSARHMRLKCMSCIIKEMDGSNQQHVNAVSKIVGEVLLCLKDSNGKTRESAYQLLLSMATLREDDMTEYFRIILAALGAQTPHMRSAAVMALSRLVFELAREDMAVQALLPSLLQTVIILFNENSREVIKSVVGFVRVSVAAMTPEQLEPLLPELVGGLLKYHRGKDRFRAKIKIILKKLVRTYGYEALLPLVPEGDERLLTHMRKLDERAKRRKAAQQQDGGEEQNHAFDDMMESDEEDSDDGRTFATGATGFTRMTGRTGKSVRTAATAKSDRRSIAASTMASGHTTKSDAATRAPRLRAETVGEVLDMLDPKMTKSVQFADDVMDGSDDEDAVMEFDEQGRLVVPNDLDNDVGYEQDGDTMDDDFENDEIKVGGKKRRLSKFESAKVAREAAQKKRSSKKQSKILGAAYKSKKAGGDVKRKDQKFEPYAYVPLDGKSYTKKHRRAAVEQMSSVVRHGKRKRR